jgi:hypothetical protein
VRIVDRSQALLAHDTYDELDGALAAFLVGSRGRKWMVDDRSDWDVLVVLRDDAAKAAFDAEYPYVHGSRIEVISTTLDRLGSDDEVGTPREQQRYIPAHATLIVDKSGGTVPRIAAAREYLPQARRDEVVRDALDNYINSTYRSLRYDTRLDAVESVPYALRAIFALAGRVRPYAKYVEWELLHHPLEGWDDSLTELLDRVADGEQDALHELFVRVERVARRGGFGDTVDGWEPDLDWLRGAGGYRTRSTT